MWPSLARLMLVVVSLGPIAACSIAARPAPAGPAAVTAQAAPTTLSYSSFIGGTKDDRAFNSAVDPSGSFYLVGQTDSGDFPPGGRTVVGKDVFIVKLAPDGARLWTQFLGGNGDDIAYAVAYDPTGGVLVTGSTSSDNFNLVNAAQTTYGGNQDGFVARLRADTGAVVWSTYVGGSGTEQVNGIVARADGSALIHGHTESPNLRTLNAFQPTIGGKGDSFVAGYTPVGALAWCSFLGGNDGELSAGAALDSSGALYVTGQTLSSNFPVKNALQGNIGGFQDGFVTKIAPAGNEIVWSTFLGGGQYDLARAIAVDSAGRIAVAGWTASINFPIKNAVQSVYGGGIFDGFISLLAPDGRSLLWSTYFGGNARERFRGVAISSVGVSVVGYTESTNYPTLNPVQAAPGGVGTDLHDIVVTQIGLDGRTRFSTYHGGSGNDVAFGITDHGGKIAIAGGSTSANLPLAEAKQPALAGGEDAIIAIYTGPTLARGPLIPIAGVNATG
ncbi:MAG: SBBP repeat-containing protein [Dehalococcoidia bacterium]